MTNSPKFSWRDAPDLMIRLTTAQNNLRAPIDIMTFAAFCDSREKLEAHVIRYEAKVAKAA
jgi:hypothetical protein